MYAGPVGAARDAAFDGVLGRALTTLGGGRLIRRSQRTLMNLAEDHDMPIGRRIITFAAIAAVAGAVACSSDSAVAPGATVAESEIDQTIASDVGESFAGDVSQFQENESFEENMSAGSSTFMTSRAGVGTGTASRTVTCSGPDGSGWFGCVAYTARGLTITRQVRFWSGGSLALGWSGTLTDSVNHRWSRTGSFSSARR